MLEAVDIIKGCSMITPKLKWSWSDGEGDVKFPQEFRDLDEITRADALQDWMEILEKEYKDTMEKWVDRLRNRS